jgi:transcriptional regulator with XRE-family HTH domain
MTGRTRLILCELEMIAAQCRAGRDLLNMTVKELAARARVATDTIVRLENGQEMKPRTIDAIRMALEAAGVEFLPAGVRLKCGPMWGWAGRR